MTRSVLRLLTERGRLEKLYYKQIYNERNEEVYAYGHRDVVKMAATGKRPKSLCWGSQWPRKEPLVSRLASTYSRMQD
jgi:hypothetical protein